MIADVVIVVLYELDEKKKKKNLPYRGAESTIWFKPRQRTYTISPETAWVTLYSFGEQIRRALLKIVMLLRGVPRRRGSVAAR